MTGDVIGIEVSVAGIGVNPDKSGNLSLLTLILFLGSDEDGDTDMIGSIDAVPVDVDDVEQNVEQDHGSLLSGIGVKRSRSPPTHHHKYAKTDIDPAK